MAFGKGRAEAELDHGTSWCVVPWDGSGWGRGRLELLRCFRSVFLPWEAPGGLSPRRASGGSSQGQSEDYVVGRAVGHARLGRLGPVRAHYCGTGRETRTLGAPDLLQCRGGCSQSNIRSTAHMECCCTSRRSCSPSPPLRLCGALFGPAGHALLWRSVTTSFRNDGLTSRARRSLPASTENRHPGTK